MKHLSGLLIVTTLGCIFGSASVMAGQNLHQQGLALERQSNFAGAERVWRNALKENPNDVEAWAHLGLDAFRRNHYKEASNAFRKAVQLDPHAADLRMNLGVSLFKARDFQQAAPVFASLLQQQPGSQQLTVLLGMSYYGAGDFIHAIPYLRRAAEAQPKDAALKLSLANSCLWAKQFACFRTAYKQIVALNGESAETDVLAAEALSEEGKRTEAIQAFHAALKANPNEAEAHLGLGYLLWAQRDYAAAEKELRANLAADPTNPKSLTYLGDTLLHLHKPQQARNLLEQARIQNPSSQLVYLDLGTIADQSGHKQLALKEYKRAISIDPNYVAAYWKLGKLEASQGNKQAAKRDFAKLAELESMSARKQYQKVAGSAVARRPMKRKGTSSDNKHNR